MESSNTSTAPYLPPGLKSPPSRSQYIEGRVMAPHRNDSSTIGGLGGLLQVGHWAGRANDCRSWPDADDAGHRTSAVGASLPCWCEPATSWTPLKAVVTANCLAATILWVRGL